MRLENFIKLSGRTKLFRSKKSWNGKSKEFYKKSEVVVLIENQILDDLLCGVSKKEIKERVRNLVNDFSIPPTDEELLANIAEIIKELKLNG